MDSDLTNLWFVCPRPNPWAEIRLLLFPYAGGGLASFGKWPAELPNTIESWIAHYPGRGSRFKEAPFKRIDPLAQSLSQAIRPFLNKPFAFFGHSLGALVAFELAKRLQQQHLPQPKILFVSACSAPGTLNPHPPLHDLPDTQFLQALQTLNGIPNEVMNIPELMELLLPTLRADFEAAETYTSIPEESPLNCPIIALGGLDDPRIDSGRLEGWSSHTASTFKSYYFPGNHFFINTAQEAVTASIASELISFHAKN